MALRTIAFLPDGKKAQAALLLLGLGIYAYRRRQAKWNENLEGRSSAGNCGPAATMHLRKGA